MNSNKTDTKYLLKSLHWPLMKIGQKRASQIHLITSLHHIYRLSSEVEGMVRYLPFLYPSLLAIR